MVEKRWTARLRSSWRCDRRRASRAAGAETLAMAVYMGAGPSVMYAAQALEAVDQIAAKAASSA
jgi:hypothetical protein